MNEINYDFVLELIRIDMKGEWLNKDKVMYIMDAGKFPTLNRHKNSILQQ